MSVLDQCVHFITSRLKIFLQVMRPRAAVDTSSGSSPPQRWRPRPHTSSDSADTCTPTRAHARPSPRRRPSRRAEGSLTSSRAEQPVCAPLQHAAAISAVAAAAAAVRRAARCLGAFDKLWPTRRRPRPDVCVLMAQRSSRRGPTQTKLAQTELGPGFTATLSTNRYPIFLVTIFYVTTIYY